MNNGGGIVTFQEMQRDFVTRRRGGLALPITGIIVYSLVALLTLVIDPRWHNAVLAICFWLIMPVGALMMKLRGETSGSPKENPLFDLSAKARWMALSTWAVHIPVWIYAPDLFPLTVGILFALHWVVFSWTLGHPIGFYHLGMRIAFVLIAWYLASPEYRVGAVAVGVTLAYAISVWILSRIDWEARLGVLLTKTVAQEGAEA